MSVLILILVMAYASVSDCMTHKIPNWLCLFALVVGIGLQITSEEPVSVLSITASVVVPFLIFIPFYIGGGMAAGDVKLMAACGALLGWPTALLATGMVLMVGTFMGVCVYLYRGGWSSFATRYGSAIYTFCGTGKFFMQPASENSVAKSRFPFALAIAFGCAASVMF